MEVEEVIRSILSDLSDVEYKVFYYLIKQKLPYEEVQERTGMPKDEIDKTVERIHKKFEHIDELKNMKDKLKAKISTAKAIKEDDIEKLKEIYNQLDIRLKKDVKLKEDVIYVERKSYEKHPGAKWTKIDFRDFYFSDTGDPIGEREKIKIERFKEKHKRTKNAEVDGFKLKIDVAEQQKEELTEFLTAEGFRVEDSIKEIGK